MSDRIEMVPFEGRQMMTIERFGTVLVVMKPVVEVLGLAWQGQLERMKRHPVISEGISVTLIPSAGGFQDAVVLDLERFHGWLATISTERIADPKNRELIETYQRRAFRVLFEYFYGEPKRTEEVRTIAQTHRLQNQISNLMVKMRKTSNVAERDVLHFMLADECRMLGIAVPPRDGLGSDAPAHPDITKPFFAAVELLQRLGQKVNHSRDLGLIAINLPQFKALCLQHDIDVFIDRQMLEALRVSVQPRFVADKTINSRITGTGIHCWVFEANAARPQMVLKVV